MIEAIFSKRLGSFNLTASMSDSGFILLSGRNGAGKSTFLLTLAGQYVPDTGDIRVNGREVSRVPLESRRIAFVNQSTYFGHLTVKEHIMWGARGPEADERFNRVIKSLAIVFDGKVGSLSLGQRIRVALATAIMSSPELLLIDEAISNLSERDEVLKELHSLSSGLGFDIVHASQDEEGGEAVDHRYHLVEGVMTKLS